MNVIDLGFKYDIKIEFNGDFDGGYYDVEFKYITPTNVGTGETKTEIVLEQQDIEEIYRGALKLAKALKPYIRDGYYL